MDRTLKVGILRETKNPPDRRVTLTPSHIKVLMESYPFVEFYIQPSDCRCYSNDEYRNLGINLIEDLHGCDIMMGVKEVDKSTFIPGKTYLFFAHVTKKQPYNNAMFREMAERKIRLIDYEHLTTDKGERIVAFGRYAGIVGAYNGLRANRIITKEYKLKPAHQCRDLKEMWDGLRGIELKSGLKILITGGGRVANGAMETLNVCNISQVNPDDFRSREYDIPVFCRIGPEHYTKHKGRQQFSFDHFTKHPDQYESNFSPYTGTTDLLITGHYWDPRSPVFFTKDDMKKPGFRISVIADISCDINGPIPSTLRASTISDPFYGYNPHLETEEPAFSRSENITVMSVDNLPGELPRDASTDFGRQLMQNALHDLFSETESPMIERATILKFGKLTQHFNYLNEYLSG